MGVKIMDYQGYKLLDQIMLVCRAEAEHDDSHGVNRSGCYQAYLVDPANKKQLESARYWAKWTEYGPSFKNEETGKWEREYEIKHDPVEFTFDNNGFELELKDCAGGSSQGGKLSFWNCLVTKDNKTFMIGINSDMLLDLLKNASFDKGKCQSPLIFITQKGKVGMTVKDSETYQQCVKDRELISTLKKTQTSKFSFGDLVSTATINEVYLGTITKYYDFDAGEKNSNYRYWNHFDIRECTITKLKNPVTYHLFDSLYKKTALSEILNNYDSSIYSYPGVKKTCPKRTITGKINMDCTEGEFKQEVMNKTYDFEAFNTKLQESYTYKGCNAEKAFYYFLGKQTFGYGFEPFELPEDLMNKIKIMGIRYVDETETK
jgi:hypothetical protein